MQKLSNNLYPIASQLDMYSNKTKIIKRLRQLQSHYGSDLFNDAMIGYHTFSPNMTEISRHITNLHITYTKVKVLNVYIDKFRAINKKVA